MTKAHFLVSSLAATEEQDRSRDGQGELDGQAFIHVSEPRVEPPLEYQPRNATSHHPAILIQSCARNSYGPRWSRSVPTYFRHGLERSSMLDGVRTTDVVLLQVHKHVVKGEGSLDCLGTSAVVKTKATGAVFSFPRRLPRR